MPELATIAFRQIALNFVNVKYSKLTYRERAIVEYLKGLDVVIVEGDKVSTVK